MIYFQKLLNENYVRNVNLGIGRIEKIRYHMYLCRIRVSNINEALRRMKIQKALGPYGIPIKVWKCMEDDSLSWLIKLFNKIIRTKKIARKVEEKYCGAYLQERGGYSKLHQLPWGQAYEPCNETMGESD